MFHQRRLRLDRKPRTVLCRHDQCRYDQQSKSHTLLELITVELSDATSELLARRRQWQPAGRAGMTRGQRIASAFLVLIMAVGEPSVAIESAKYTVTTHDGPFEFRNYPPVIVAVVTVDGTRSHAVNSGFRQLADYIFGNNQQQSKIAMTAPVTQSRRSPQPVTLPVPTIPDSDSWAISFLMPAGYALQSLPAPNNHRLRFEQVPGRRVAAMRFSGFWSDTNLESHQIQLLRWMKVQHVEPLSAPTYAYYDPPWTPWFLRRIEVLIEVAPTG